MCFKFFFLMHVLFVPLVAKESLKILFVLHEFPKFNQPFILNQITGLIDLGHEIDIYANHSPYNILPVDVRKYNLLSKTYYRKLPQNKDYDIIYCHFGIDGYVGLRLKEKYSLSGKIVTCFRGDDITQFLRPDLKGNQYRNRGPYKIPCYFSKMYDELFRRGDLFLPVCEYFAKKMRKLGCDSKKIIVHHSAINMKSYLCLVRKKEKHIPVRFITVGRMVELKGTEYLIRAFAYLKYKYHHKRDIKLYIIGDGPLKDPLKVLVKQLKLENVIVFLGWQPHEKIQNYLLHSHIFVLPSVITREGIMEGIPNALMEAMATGMPCISTYHSGIPELLINNKGGYLVKSRDYKALAQKMHELVIDQKLWDKLGKNARKSVEKGHNIDRENKELEKIFYRLVKTSRAANEV